MGQEGNTRWGGIIRKNLAVKAIPEKQCDEYTRYRRLLSIDGALKCRVVSWSDGR